MIRRKKPVSLKLKKIKGSVQELVGVVTGNADLELLGLREQLVATIQGVYNLSALAAAQELEFLCSAEGVNRKQLIKELQCCKLIFTAL